ncbi:MAG: proton-conducting transporter membrane subunit [Spirochaetota bacterium]
MKLEFLLIMAFGGAFFTYLVGKISARARNFFAVVISCGLTAAIAFLYGAGLEKTFYLGFLDLPLLLRLNMLSWFFAVTIAGVGALSIIFSLSYIRGKERTDFYYLMMMLVNAGMLGIVLSGDLVSFYIFWEIMSWSAFLLISYNRGPALAAGMKYIIMSVVGSVGMLIGILSLYASYETLVISELSVHIASASPGYVLFLLLLFFGAFGIKNAVWPFHTWLPPAHSEAPSPFSAVLSGILVRMGMYGFLIIFYGIVGLKLFMGLGKGIYSFHHILAWIGAINIVIPTFIAMLQNDSKRLLAWHGVGQGGYMVLGTVLGTNLGLAGGTFHIVNHTSYIALLFLVVGAVEYRTRGVRDLNSLGGLIKKMPVTFIGALIGACGLIGVPLTNGFVSKWLIYKTLILGGHPLLAFAALIGTWGTILSLYKFLHNMFLGQLPEKYKNIEEAPFSMQFPIIVFSMVIILFGILPGIPLKVINAIGTSFGFESLNVVIWGIASETGTLNTINIFAAIIGACIIVWLIARPGKKAPGVDQYDSYAAGAAVPADRYHYTVDFYNPLYRMINPYLRDFVDEFYMKLAAWTRRLCNGVRRVYAGDVGYYAIYIILFLALLIFVQVTWSIW